MKNLKRQLLVSTLSLPLVAQAQVYIVAKNDSFSQIASRHLGLPVWGKRGTLKKLAELNPHIKNLNRIYPGQQILLSEEIKPEVVETKTKEIMSTPVEVKVAEEKPQTPVTFEIIPKFAFSNMDMVDTRTGGTSSLASQYYVALEGRYLQPWSERFTSYMSLGISQIQFAKPQDSNKSLENRNKTLFGVGVGAQYGLTAKMTFEGYFKYQQQVFARAKDSTHILVDSVAIPAIGSKLSYDLYTSRPYTIGVSALAELLMSGKADSYDVKSGSAFGGGLYMKQNPAFKNWSLQTELTLYNRSQDTDIVEQDEQVVMLSIFLK